MGLQAIKYATKAFIVIKQRNFWYFECDMCVVLTPISDYSKKKKSI